MKKLITAILACTMITASFASCQPKKKSQKNTSVPTVSKQDGDSAEDALREIYELIYTFNGGEAFYQYNFPQKVIDILKNCDKYDEAVKTYNQGQAQYLDVADQAPAIQNITSSVPFTDEQLRAAERYFFAVADQQVTGIKADDIKALEGYEFKLDITNSAGIPDTDTECMVKLENDGWKLISVSASGLLEGFGDDAVNSTDAAENTDK